MREQIKKALQTIKGHFGTSIFANPQQFKAALADTPIESDADTARNLLRIAVCDIQAYSRLETALANNNLFIVDNLTAEMSSKYVMDKAIVRMVIECIAELLGYTPKSAPQPKPHMPPQSATAQHSPQTSSTASDPLLKRVFIFLQDGEWEKADEYCERILDADPENAMAYVGKLCAELKIKSEADLASCKHPLENMPNYKKAIRFADTNYRVMLDGYNRTINERLAEEKRLEQERIAAEKQRKVEDEKQKRYNDFVNIMNKASSADDYENLAKQFRDMNGYKNTAELAKECDNQCRNRIREREAERERNKKHEITRIQEYQRRIEQSESWLKKGLCRHCGGQIGGLFTKKCKSCEKSNEEGRIEYITIPFGNYDWRVLSVQSNKVLILTEDIIERRPYNSQGGDITWEACTLRKYLNGEFLQKFTPEDQRRIIETQITNNNNPWYNTKGGNATKDKIFLLSLEEVVKYFGDSGKLRNNGSSSYIDDQYNSARVAKDANSSACWWWLWSPGNGSNRAAYVNGGGTVSVYGLLVHTIAGGGGGVRPALWLNL